MNNILKLKTYCIVNDIAQSEMADNLGIHRQSLQSYFVGRYNPTKKNLEKISNFLDMNPQGNEVVALLEDPVQSLRDFKKNNRYSLQGLSELMDISTHTIHGWFYANHTPCINSVYKITKFLKEK